MNTIEKIKQLDPRTLKNVKYVVFIGLALVWLVLPWILN